MTTTTKGAAGRRTLGELLPVVGVALVVALVVAMVVGPSTSNLRARLSLVDGPASVQAGSPEATSQAGVTVQLRPPRADAPANTSVGPEALVTGDLGRIARASANASDSKNSTSSSDQRSTVRIAPVSAAPLLASPRDVAATPAATPVAPASTTPVAPAPDLSVAAAPSKHPTKSLKPTKPTPSTTSVPKAGRGSPTAPTGGVPSDPSHDNGGGSGADEKASIKAEAEAERAADKADRSANFDKPPASTKKDKV